MSDGRTDGQMVRQAIAYSAPALAPELQAKGGQDKF